MRTPASLELVRSLQLTDRAPYVYAAVTHGISRLVLTAGACPLDEHGATVAVGDVAEQAEQVMANLAAALQAAGAGLDDVVKSTVYVASQRGKTCSTPGRWSPGTSGTTTPRAPCSGSPSWATPTSSSRLKLWPPCPEPAASLAVSV